MILKRHTVIKATESIQKRMQSYQKKDTKQLKTEAKRAKKT